MNLKLGFLSMFFFFGYLTIYCQDVIPVTDFHETLQSIIEDFTEFGDGNADFDFNTLYEDLRKIYVDKLDINKSTAAELSQLAFLSNIDIQNIINYRNNYGDFLSIYELQSVSGLTIEKLSVLKLFIKEGSISRVTKDLKLTQLDGSSNKLYLKWKYNLETAQDFKPRNAAPPRYIGDKHHLYLRYNHSSSKVKYGFITEKDPGEKITNERSETGLDYLSLHYQISNPTSWIKQLNLGDYSVSMGQGLIAHSAFGIGKSSLTTRVKKGRSGIRAYNSVSENLAFRGLALDILPTRSNWSGTVFGSYVPRDANLSGVDINGRKTFSSLPSGGLHRTEGEREDQDGVTETTVGANLKYKIGDALKIGINGIHHRFDKVFRVTQQPYQLFRWQGDQLTNVSTDYNALVDGWNIFGEIARSSSGGWAHMHGLIKTLDPRFDISFVYRDYSAEYQSLYANAFGESSRTNNERGVYLGLEFRPARKWSIKAFVDQWQNDWLRFRVDGPSTGREYLFRLDYKERRRRHFYLQYRYEIKDENSAADLLIDIPVPKITQRLRLHASHQLDHGIELRSRLEFSLFQKEEDTERGILVYQDFISRKEESPFSLRARIAYFNITDFDARIYTYENDLLFEYYIPSFSGQGLRYYVHLRYNISRSVMAEMRFEQTRGFGAKVIGVAGDLFESSVVSRVKAQVRWSF